MAAPRKGKGKARDFDFEFSGARKWKAYAEGEAAAASGSKVQHVQTSTEIATPQPTIESQPPASVLPPTTVPAQTYTVVSHARPTRSNPGWHSNHPQSGLPGRFSALPDIQAINRRRDHDVAPEGIVLDNEAHQRARAGEPPDDLYNFSLFFPDGFKGKFYGPRDINLSYIAAKTDTYIAPSALDIHTVEMWGPREGIEEAKEDLYKLGQFALRSTRLGVVTAKGKFGKTNAPPTEVQAERIAKSRSVEAKRLHYKQTPEDPTAFPVIGVFSWPEDINPQTALGMNTEAFDSIRSDHACHIEYVRKTQSFQVYGMKTANVQEALDRIHGVLCEIATKNRCLGATATRVHMVVPPTSEQLLMGVHLDGNHNLKDRQITVKRLPENGGVQCHLTGRKPARGALATWEKKREALLKANSAFLRKVVQRGLDDTLYCRAHVVMKVNFGTLVLFGYQRPAGNAISHDTMYFMEMMRGKGIHAEVLRHIGSMNVAKELISICRTRDVIFTPIHKNSPYILGHPEMIYTATFALTLSDSSTSTDIRLECQFGKEEIVGNKQQFRIIHWSWLSTPRHGHQYKTSHDNEGAYKRKGPLDIKVLDLAENLAWQLEISSYSRLPHADLYPIFNDFIHNVTLDVPLPTPADREEGPVPLMNFVNLHGLDVESVCVKTKFQWYISTTPYIFEVTKYDFYLTPRHTPEGVSANVKGIVPDTRWGASLTSQEWIDKLGAQWSLPIGCRGMWKPAINAFFKPTEVGGINDPLVDGKPKMRAEWAEDGFKEFEGRINECLGLIVKAKKSSKRRIEMAKRGVHEDDMD